MSKSKNTIWNMFECEHGARWTAVKDGMCDEPVGECGFSGCYDGHHTFKLISETEDGAKALVWFRRPTIDSQVKELMKETNSTAEHFKDQFWNMCNDKTSASWGWAEPLRFKGLVIVWLTFSPQHKGDKQRLFYDYMTINEYEAGEDID